MYISVHVLNLHTAFPNLRTSNQSTAFCTYPLQEPVEDFHRAFFRACCQRWDKACFRAPFASSRAPFSFSSNVIERPSSTNQSWLYSGFATISVSSYFLIHVLFLIFQCSLLAFSHHTYQVDQFCSRSQLDSYLTLFFMVLKRPMWAYL